MGASKPLARRAPSVLHPVKPRPFLILVLPEFFFFFFLRVLTPLAPTSAHIVLLPARYGQAGSKAHISPPSPGCSSLHSQAGGLGRGEAACFRAH